MKKQILLALVLFAVILTVEPAVANEKISPVIAHGGGMYRQFETSNSVEAVLQAIENGVTLIELDLSLTSDGEIIMLHDWNRTITHYLGENFDQRLSKNQFENCVIFGELEPLTFDKLIKILDKNPQVRIITDTKEDTLPILEKIAEKYSDYKGKMIPQIYEYEEFEPVHALGYEDVILTVYLQEKPDAEGIISFAKTNDLYGVTMPEYEARKGLCKAVAKEGIPVFVHPINTYEDAKEFMELGATAVYSGSLLPQELEGLESTYYLANKDAEGKFIRSTDFTLSLPKIEDLLQSDEIKLLGLKLDEKARVSLDESGEKIQITLYDKSKNKKGVLTYGVAIYGSQVRIVQEKLAYRLEGPQMPKDFEQVLNHPEDNGEPTPEEINEILRNSFIVKAGTPLYYSNGKGKVYKNGKDSFAVGYINGNLKVPVADTLMALGAESVYMTQDWAIVTVYEGEKYRAEIDSYYLRNSFQLFRLKTPISLYLRKSVASPQLFEIITQRPTIEMEGLLIILPPKIRCDKDMEKQLLRQAKKLF